MGAPINRKRNEMDPRLGVLDVAVNDGDGQVAPWTYFRSSTPTRWAAASDAISSLPRYELLFRFLLPWTVDGSALVALPVAHCATGTGIDDQQVAVSALPQRVSHTFNRSDAVCPCAVLGPAGTCLVLVRHFYSFLPFQKLL